MKGTITRWIHRYVYGYIIMAVVTGFIVGMLTLLGQAYLPGNLNSLANLGPVWLVPAFFVSAMGDRVWKSMLAGWLCLTGMVGGYYWFEPVWNHHAFFIGRWLIVWLLIAIVAGAIFGTAGYLWRHREHRWHSLGSALLAGVFLADGINMLLHYASYSHMIPVPITEIVVGALLILLLERNKQDRLRGYAVLVPIVALGLIGYGILFML
jgi:hypothetical protein